MLQSFWAKVKNVDPKDLVFLDEIGVLLGLMRTHARAAPGERAYDYKSFYRGSKVSVIGAITESKVLAVMTVNDSMPYFWLCRKYFYFWRHNPINY